MRLCRVALESLFVFLNFRVEWLDPIKVDLPFNQTLYTFPLPGSGAIVTFIMNILKGFLDYGQGESITNLQRTVESFKYGYGKRTELGDRNFVPGMDDVSILNHLNHDENQLKNIYCFSLFLI